MCLRDQIACCTEDCRLVRFGRLCIVQQPESNWIFSLLLYVCLTKALLWSVYAVRLELCLAHVKDFHM